MAGAVDLGVCDGWKVCVAVLGLAAAPLPKPSGFGFSGCAAVEAVRFQA